MDVLVDLRAVDIDLHDPGAPGKVRRLGGHPVGEARPDDQQQVRAVDRESGGDVAVHPDHPHVERIIVGKHTGAHDGMTCRNRRTVSQFINERRCTGTDHPAAEVDHRTFGRVDQRGDLGDHRRINLGGTFGRRRGGSGKKLAGGGGHILGNIDQHRAGPAGIGDGKRLTDRIGQILDPAHNEIVLGNRHRDAGDVNLLEAVRADLCVRDVGGNRHHRNGIHVGGGDSGHEVGASRPGGGKDNPRFAGGPGISVGRVGCALLVGGDEVADSKLVVIESVVYVQDSPARISEYGVNLLLGQHFENDLRTCHQHYCSSSSILCGTAPRRKIFADKKTRPCPFLGKETKAKFASAVPLFLPLSAAARGTVRPSQPASGPGRVTVTIPSEPTEEFPFRSAARG